MTYIANPRHYTREEFRALVDSLSWNKGWRPKFPTLHNTGNPSLKQWIAYGPTVEERWGASLNNYYLGLGWHSGPHLVCCPDYIWNLCDLEQDGVSVSCWNHLTIGIEMVGDYSVGADNPSIGDGAKVIDNAVWALAVLSRKFGWAIGDVETGVKGLHFHRECAQDHHACPGGMVNKSEIIGRVVAQMTALGSPSAPIPPLPAPSPPVAASPPPSDPQARRKWIQAFLVAHGATISVDGEIGIESETAIAAFLAKHAA